MFGGGKGESVLKKFKKEDNVEELFVEETVVLVLKEFEIRKEDAI